MISRDRPASFREQMRHSIGDLRQIIETGASPSGNGRLTVRTLEVVEPSVYDAKALRRLRRSMNLSQALFARLIGVSGSLVRSWELGTRAPSPIARRLLDEVRAHPGRFAGLVRVSRSATARTVGRARRVA